MKVLIIDDSAVMRNMIKRALQAGGIEAEVVEAKDGADGLAKTVENPDIILCDWNMPNMTGPELLAAMKDEGYNNKFGFVTTEATPKMRETAEELGARFLIAKPFTAASFANTLAPFLG